MSARTVAKLLKDSGYSLQGNTKTIEGIEHVDRDAQFAYIAGQVIGFQAKGDPVISVDTKKKELVGNFVAAGREWEPTGNPRAVNVHDFEDKKLGKVAPYGVYDITANTGWVTVGTDADTGQFAVESIRRWWDRMGAKTYPTASRLLITADSGGSNGSRLRLWKTESPHWPRRPVSRSPCATSPRVPRSGTRSNTVCSPRSAPTGVGGRWNHKRSSSKPSGRVTTKTGLTVHAEPDNGTYPRGIRISDRDMQFLNESGVLIRHKFHGDWNYTIAPATRSRPPT